MRWLLGLSSIVVAVVPARADVIAATPSGFEARTSVTIAAPPAKVWAVLVTPARWWDGAHSYSGNASNLTLAPHAGGCFCEKLPAGGSVEHARVVLAKPGELLRLDGALGPLQGEALAGRMTFSLKPEGAGTALTMRYVVGGYAENGADRFAVPVDRIMAMQVGRLKAAVEKN